MSSTLMELRQLATFVLACQNPTTSGTAQELDIAPSTLSVTLSKLEDQLGMKLFERIGRHLYPLPAAIWLFQHASGILHAESHVRTRLRLPCGLPTRWLKIDLDLSFSIGLFSKALGGAVEDLRRQRPDVFAEYTFRRAASVAASAPAPFGPDFAGAPAASVRLFYHRPGEPAKKVVFRDHWIMARLNPLPHNIARADAPIVVLQMAPELIAAITAYAGAHGFAHLLRFSDDHPIDLPRLMLEMPDTGFVVPRSMLAGRLGLVDPSIEPLHPALVSLVGAEAAGDEELAALFLDVLAARLGQPERNTLFEPRLTMRQLHYFSLTQQCGGISAAARTARVAQPAVSSQLRKLEQVLGGPLFERRDNALVATPLGSRLGPLAQALVRRTRAILQERRAVAAHTQHTISIGILPSSGHDSLMTEGMAAALTRFHDEHPQCRFNIVEDSNSGLHEAVSSGAVNFAVVGQAQPQLGRVPLGPSEPLSLIANTRLALGGRASISLDELQGLPLVLGPRQLSMHRAILALAGERNIRLVPVQEVGAIPLTIAMLRRAPLCTILPASAVRDDISRGTLTATPLADADTRRHLVVIYSTDRPLSDLERQLIGHLREAFKARAAGFLPLLAAAFE